MTAKKTTTRNNPKPVSLKVERIFDASPETLWSYWAEPEKFARWFNPAPGIDLVVHEYDVRVGGRVRFDMPQPDGNRNPQEGVFHVLRPHREIVSGSPDKSFLIAVKFAAVGKRTRMTVTVTGVPPQYHDGATKGWNAGFTKLAALLGGASPKAFTIERVFKTTPERMWALWTTKKGVESWWAPEGTAVKVIALDLKLRGTFDFEHTATTPDQAAGMRELGLPLTLRVHNIYTEIIEPRRIVFKTTLDFIPGVAPYEVTTEVDFVKVKEGTKVVFTHSKVHSKQWGEDSRQGQMSEFDRLGRLLGEVGPPSPGHRPVTLSLPSEREILISRVFDAMPDRVFRAHVDPNALAEWWGPRGYQSRVETWEPRPGGAWRIVQTAPDGTEHPFRGVFQEVVPSKRLTWTFEYEPMAGHISTQTVTFEPERGGRTKLTVRVVFGTPEDRDGMLASGMEWGMREGYEQIDEFLARTA